MDQKCVQLTTEKCFVLLQFLKCFVPVQIFGPDKKLIRILCHFSEGTKTEFIMWKSCFGLAKNVWDRHYVYLNQFLIRNEPEMFWDL